MENIRGARLRKFNLRKIILGVRMHFRHNILLTRLSSWFGIYGTALNWFRSYLYSRCFRVKCNNDFSSPYTCLCGVPQASVLGPLLFVMYTTPTFPLRPSIRFPVQHQSLTKCSTTYLFLDDCPSSHSQLF